MGRSLTGATKMNIKEMIKLAEIKKSVAATTETNINIPNYHYILKTMKVIVDVEKNISSSKDFTLPIKKI